MRSYIYMCVPYIIYVGLALSFCGGCVRTIIFDSASERLRASMSVQVAGILDIHEMWMGFFISHWKNQYWSSISICEYPIDIDDWYLYVIMIKPNINININHQLDIQSWETNQDCEWKIFALEKWSANVKCSIDMWLMWHLCLPEGNTVIVYQNSIICLKH